MWIFLLLGYRDTLTQFTEKSLSRRHFLRGNFLKSLKSDQQKQQGLNAIRPPWGDLDHFLQRCTGCHQCVVACETGILIKGQGGYPEIDFSQGKQECSFCQRCVNSCPEGVFRPTSEMAWQHKVDIAPSCLAQNGIECRSCQDSCEPRAIRFKREIGRIATPILALENCNGCGACLAHCPSQSITILRL